jgi:hypothetical protein
MLSKRKGQIAVMAPLSTRAPAMVVWDRSGGCRLWSWRCCSLTHLPHSITAFGERKNHAVSAAGDQAAAISACPARPASYPWVSSPEGVRSY